jgi:diguanylate cyclase (GGDEF)-like protein
MSSIFMELEARLRRLPDPVLFMIGLTVVAAMALFKVSAGRHIPIIDFFLVPVAGVGWLARSRWYGFGIGLVTAALSVPIATTTQGAKPGQALAAAAARFILYLVVLAVLGSLRRMQAEREAEARTDHLTGVANLRGFLEAAAAELERSRRYDRHLSLVYLDVDDFKSINDRFGHEEGDHVLRTVGSVLLRLVRSVDTVGRIGGDEFVVLAPETDAQSVQSLVQRIRAEIAGIRADDGQAVTCSIGLVTFGCTPASVSDLLRSGDRLMYRAKAGGKDRVESELVTA